MNPQDAGMLVSSWNKMLHCLGDCPYRYPPSLFPSFLFFFFLFLFFVSFYSFLSFFHSFSSFLSLFFFFFFFFLWQIECFIQNEYEYNSKIRKKDVPKRYRQKRYIIPKRSTGMMRYKGGVVHLAVDKLDVISNTPRMMHNKGSDPSFLSLLHSFLSFLFFSLPFFPFLSSFLNPFLFLFFASFLLFFFFFFPT